MSLWRDILFSAFKKITADLHAAIEALARSLTCWSVHWSSAISTRHPSNFSHFLLSLHAIIRSNYKKEETYWITTLVQGMYSPGQVISTMSVRNQTNSMDKNRFLLHRFGYKNTYQKCHLNVVRPIITLSLCHNEQNCNKIRRHWVDILLFRIRKIPSSNLGRETVYNDWGFSWYSPVPPGKYQNSVLRKATPASPTSFPVHRPLIILSFEAIHRNCW